MMESYPPSLRYLIRLLLVFAIIATLIIAKTLLAPLFFAILFAYMLFPAAEWLENRDVPRIAANFILVAGSILLLATVIYLIASLLSSFSQNIPEIKHQFKENITSFQEALENDLGISISNQENMLESLGTTGQYMERFFSATANTALAFGLIPVYTFLLLFYRNKFRRFISMVVSSSYENAVDNIVDQIARVMPQYLKGLLVVCFLLMGLNSLGFYLIGIKYALVLGIIAAIFNLIPYLGTVIGYGVVFLFVLSTQSPSLAMLVLFQFFIVQFLENNILTPNITGSYVRINPLVTIFFLIAGGMIWGLPGMFMIIPYLAMLKVACENIPALKPVAYLLGTRGAERHAITFQSLKRVLGLKEDQA